MKFWQRLGPDGRRLIIGGPIVMVGWGFVLAAAVGAAPEWVIPFAMILGPASAVIRWYCRRRFGAETPRA